MCKVNYARIVKLIMPSLSLLVGWVVEAIWLTVQIAGGTAECSGANDGVIGLTSRRNYVYMTVDGQTQDARSQNRSAAATRMPESASGESHRSAVFGIGLFRRT